MELFSIFSGLKSNKSKCELAGVGVLKRVQMALFGMKCVNLKNNTIKILGIDFSYNKSLENDENNYKIWKIIQIVENVTAKNWR